MIDFLREEGISGSLLDEAARFAARYGIDAACADRIPVPRFHYFGREVWEEAITAVLAGCHLLLSGSKATGKNVLAENLAALFGRPIYEVSFHINTDAASLLGSDSYGEGRVYLRKGPVYQCAEAGGFGVLDEINMAKNESLAVLHAILDYRRVIDMPGYSRIHLHEATRFIGTMNYGYAGTRDLNEALTSRFVVIDMPQLDGDGLARLFRQEFPELDPRWAEQLAAFFEELQTKCTGGEISTRSLDLRGMLSAIALMKQGLDAFSALKMGLANKCFDDYEKQLVLDVAASRFPKEISSSEVFSR